MSRIKNYFKNRKRLKDIKYHRKDFEQLYMVNTMKEPFERIFNHYLLEAYYRMYDKEGWRILYPSPPLRIDLNE